MKNTVYLTQEPAFPILQYPEPWYIPKKEVSYVQKEADDP